MYGETILVGILTTNYSEIVLILLVTTQVYKLEVSRKTFFNLNLRSTFVFGVYLFGKL